MITGELKNKIDSLWDIFAAGGIVNPLTVIEQITYLMFILVNASSSDSFILTAVYMSAEKPQEHFKRIQNSRKHMREKYTRV